MIGILLCLLLVGAAAGGIVGFYLAARLWQMMLKFPASRFVCKILSGISPQRRRRLALRMVMFATHVCEIEKLEHCSRLLHILQHRLEEHQLGAPL